MTGSAAEALVAPAARQVAAAARTVARLCRRLRKDSRPRFWVTEVWTVTTPRVA